MRQGQQVFPHKYKQRFRKDGKWVYVYAPEGTRDFAQAVKGTREARVVFCHGKPTAIRYDDAGFVVFGPPNVVAKKLFVNRNPKKRYFAIAKDPAGVAEDVYMYPESAIRKSAMQKAAKLVKTDAAFQLLDADARMLMASTDPQNQELGLAIWLNNNTAMRIGAHEDSGSVDSMERAGIINRAKKENWSDMMKKQALEMSKKPTFGLLTLRIGNMTLNSDAMTATFRFTGKGAKENMYTAPLTPPVFSELFRRKVFAAGKPEEKLFPSINYKKVYRWYKKYGITPHSSRHAFADRFVKQLMKDFNVKDGESARVAVRRFNNMLSERVSQKLNHTRSMTERSYLTRTMQSAVNEFRDNITERAGRMMESVITTRPLLTEALPTALLWLDIGVGNHVI